MSGVLLLGLLCIAARRVASQTAEPANERDAYTRSEAIIREMRAAHPRSEVIKAAKAGRIGMSFWRGRRGTHEDDGFFLISRTPVTNKQYWHCVADGGCRAPKEDFGHAYNFENQPVVGLTREQAQAFARWMGGRLPTEDEWSYTVNGAKWDGRLTDLLWQKPYPWRESDPSCERAVVAGCSKPAREPFFEMVGMASGDEEQHIWRCNIESLKLPRRSSDDDYCRPFIGDDWPDTGFRVLIDP